MINFKTFLHDLCNLAGGDFGPSSSLGVLAGDGSVCDLTIIIAMVFIHVSAFIYKDLCRTVRACTYIKALFLFFFLPRGSPR